MEPQIVANKNACLTSEAKQEFADSNRKSQSEIGNFLMEQLIKSLPAILHAAGDSEEVAQAAAFAAWKHAIGEGLRNHAVPVRLHEKRLIVAVADTIWQKQLEPMRGHLLFRVNAILGQPLVSYIELRIDPQRMEKASEFQPRRKQRDEAQIGDLGIPFELRSAATGIQDAELRKAFLGAALTCMKRADNQRSGSESK
jgi:hypothetical protein